MTAAKKRLIVACDGTWQKLASEYPTNVVKLVQGVLPAAEDGTLQLVYYSRGLGTDSNEKIGGGAFGWGIDRAIQDAYIFICLNYTPGDELYLFGFSRGAYTVRSLAGLLHYCGLLQRSEIRQVPRAYDIYRTSDGVERQRLAQAFRQETGVELVPITLLGCWDTVGSLGLPDLTTLVDIEASVNQKYQFHDMRLSPMVQNACHAVAVDEYRKAFNVTLMEAGEDFPGRLQQLWFPGDHGCSGGGTSETAPLGNAALQWMVQAASEVGLSVDLTESDDAEQVDWRVPFESKGLFRRSIDDFDALHISVKQRWRDVPSYRPSNLQQFQQQLDGWAQQNPQD